MKRVKIFMIVSLTVIALTTNGQPPPNFDSVKAELYKVNKVFDSSYYLGFDVNIVYSSDTLFGRFEHEEMSGKYILNNRNMYYKMGDIEYVQNDSFVYNIYHDEKMIMMTKDVLASNSTLFPLKEFVDSIITWYQSSYNISVFTVDESKVIEFTSNSNEVPYKRFAIYYEQESHYPDRFEMSMNEALNNLDDIPDTIAYRIKIKPVKKTITMSFSNYYHPKTLEMFDDGSYVSFDRQRKKYRPVEKFRAYRFLTNGVEGEEYDESIEIEAPPDDQ